MTAPAVHLVYPQNVSRALGKAGHPKVCWSASRDRALSSRRSHPNVRKVLHSGYEAWGGGNGGRSGYTEIRVAYRSVIPAPEEIRREKLAGYVKTLTLAGYTVRIDDKGYVVIATRPA
jgi:hypothetical protein